MHSRKTRINDGYYESQSRSFQNSKYSNSRYSNYYRDRDNSPKRVTEIHRSPETTGSPRDSRDRYHQNYRNKDRDRDYKKEKYPNDKRGRDRDLEYKTYSKKAKTRDRSSSDEDHKESDRVYDKNRYAADRDHSAIRRASEKERRFGDWKEMISKASGKKYYYNERDKSSQWDKPDEWVEYDMDFRSKEYTSSMRGGGYREKERDRKSRDDRYGRRNYSSNKHSRNSRWPQESYPASSSGHHKRHEDNMDISPDSTPTSEPSYSSPTANQHTNNSNINSNSLNHEDIMSSPNNGHAKHPMNATNSNNNNQLHHQISNASTSSVSSSSKLNSNNNSSNNNNNNKSSTTTTSSSSPSIHNYQPHHHRNRSTSPVHENNVVHENNMHHNSSSLRNSPSYSGSSNAAASAGGLTNSVTRLDLNNSSSNHMTGDGPPTPEMDLNSGEHRRLDATSGVSSLQSLQSVLSASQTSNRLNLLTPSLAKFFRADLITHVTNWPSEILEKQAQKCAEEVYLLGDLECSKISAEIQCARSIVRVAEIAATIQTQRRLFLQEQIKSLDESQSQNSSTISY